MRLLRLHRLFSLRPHQPHNPHLLHDLHQSHNPQLLHDLHLLPSLHRPPDQPRLLQLQPELQLRQMFRTNFFHQLCVVLLLIMASMSVHLLALAPAVELHAKMF